MTSVIVSQIHMALLLSLLAFVVDNRKRDKRDTVSGVTILEANRAKPQRGKAAQGLETSTLTRVAQLHHQDHLSQTFRSTVVVAKHNASPTVDCDFGGLPPKAAHV